MKSPSGLSTELGQPRGNGDILIKAENVGKIFCRDLKKSLFYGIEDSVKEFLPWKPSHRRDPAGLALRPGEFWANKGISFELRRGECLGLIGSNGAGKTTLLKMLNGLIKPDEGSIEVKGRVGAIIALGAGFNPILTGRENIYVNASILGLSREETDSRLEEIIDFAEVREFIDTPVQSYSSGMSVRLGFAIATAIEPDVLILDEVLAVGDAAFRTKCFVKISQLRSKAAVIFVSHSEELLKRICTQGLVLKGGEVVDSGELNGCLETYRQLLSNKISMDPKAGFLAEEIESLELHFPMEPHQSGNDLEVELVYVSKTHKRLSLHALAIHDQHGISVAVTDLRPFFHEIPSGVTRKRFSIKALSLRPGTYSFSIETLAGEFAEVLARTHFQGSIIVRGSISQWCSYTPTSAEALA